MTVSRLTRRRFLKLAGIGAGGAAAAAMPLIRATNSDEPLEDTPAADDFDDELYFYDDPSEVADANEVSEAIREFSIACEPADYRMKIFGVRNPQFYPMLDADDIGSYPEEW